MQLHYWWGDSRPFNERSMKMTYWKVHTLHTVC